MSSVQPVTRSPQVHQQVSVGELVEQMKSGRIVVATDYRPKPGRKWDRDRREALIFSLLANVPVPAIILNDRATKRWYTTTGRMDQFRAVVDGGERLLTIWQWFYADLAVPDSWFSAADLSADPKRGRVRHTNLTSEAAAKLRRQLSMDVVSYEYPSLQAEAELYELVNGNGVPRDRRS